MGDRNMKLTTITMLLALILTISLAGCGSNDLPIDTISENSSIEQGKHNAAFSESSEETTESSEDSNTSTEEALPSDINPAVESLPSDTNPKEESLPVIVPVNPEEELDEAQKNSIAMLNYLAVLSQEINSSKNSRMFLEEAYASLINNTNPEKVNELTESHLSSLLDIIEKYRMISVKRDRLQYIYDQNKAKALKEAMPNPIGLLSAVNAFDLKRLAASAIYMSVDSYSSYNAYNTDLAQEFLQDGWSLDDEEAENLHDSRKRAFMFMIEIVREDNLPGKLALSENAVDKFVSWKNTGNNYQKIQFFESEKATYEAFGSYWLELANCYYEAAKYDRCLEAMDKYEELQSEIFRKDYYLAQALPKAIVAASEIYDSEKYIPIAERYIEFLLSNTENSEWSLRYFAAEIYIDLYAKTSDTIYLDKAYKIALNNVNNLVAEQQTMNATYLADVKEVTIPKDAEKDEKNQIKDYNKSLHKQRKVELPPVYEPLVLNCDLLFALAEERNISQAEKNKIESILYGNKNDLFLSEVMKTQYSFTNKFVNTDAQFKKDTLILPVSCVSEKSIIKVTVTNNGKIMVYDDWVVKAVDRPSNNSEKFTVTYTSKKAVVQQWSKDSTVKVEIYADKSPNAGTVVIEFKVSKFKDLWVIPDTVEFVKVS